MIAVSKISPLLESMRPLLKRLEDSPRNLPLHNGYEDQFTCNEKEEWPLASHPACTLHPAMHLREPSPNSSNPGCPREPLTDSCICILHRPCPGAGSRRGALMMPRAHTHTHTCPHRDNTLFPLSERPHVILFARKAAFSTSTRYMTPTCARSSDTIHGSSSFSKSRKIRCTLMDILAV